MKKIFTLAAFAFLSVNAFAQISTLNYTASGTFTVPSGVTSLTIDLIGAGGSGQGNGTGGGGGGGRAIGVYSATPGQTLSVVVGMGGGSLPTRSTSVNGTMIYATGGANGVSVPNPNVGGGGAGGMGFNGQGNYAGGNGGGGYYTYFGGGGGSAANLGSNGMTGANTPSYTGSNCLTPGGAGGIATSSYSGNGGKGAGFTNSSCSITDPAANGGNYGGGGGGGNGIGSTPGIGGNGYVIIGWTPVTIAINNLNTEKLNLAAYPNPFTNKIHIENLKGNETFELLNSVGQLIWTGKNIEQKDLSELHSGIYFLKVKNENSSNTIKLVKE